MCICLTYAVLSFLCTQEEMKHTLKWYGYLKDFLSSYEPQWELNGEKNWVSSLYTHNQIKKKLEMICKNSRLP